MFGIYDIATVCLLVLAITVNTVSVHIQKRYAFYNRFGNNSYTVHVAVISAAWFIFVASEFLAARSSWRLDSTYPLLGISIMAAALTLFILALRQIGRHGLGNGNFFGAPIRKLGGVYQYVPEPIYVSYCLWFAGIGFASSLKVFFVLAAVGLVGLIGVEARIERP